MSSLPQQIRDKFLEKLAENEEITDEHIDALRDLLDKDTKIKAKDVEAVFTPAQDDEL